MMIGTCLNNSEKIYIFYTREVQRERVTRVNIGKIIVHTSRARIYRYPWVHFAEVSIFVREDGARKLSSWQEEKAFL